MFDGMSKVDERPRTMAGKMGILGGVPYKFFHRPSLNWPC